MKEQEKHSQAAASSLKWLEDASPPKPERQLEEIIPLGRGKFKPAPEALSGHSASDAGRQGGEVSVGFVIRLLLGAALLFGLILLLLWGIPYFGGRFISLQAGKLGLGIALGLFALALFFAAYLAAALLTRRRLPFLYRLRGLLNFALYPLLRLTGILLRIPKSKVRQAFIRLNNDLSRASRITCAPHELLILLPHCIQKSSCPHRLTHNIQACTRCGACVVGPLLQLAEKRGVEAVIVPGGTVARQIVRQKRPKCLIAVACHRDLSSGIRDVAALPVFGVSNRRPFGPCINTSVDLAEIERAICLFTGSQSAD